MTGQQQCSGFLALPTPPNCSLPLLPLPSLPQMQLLVLAVELLNASPADDAETQFRWGRLVGCVIRLFGCVIRESAGPKLGDCQQGSSPGWHA